MPYFLNVVNITAIVLMFFVYFIQHINYLNNNNQKKRTTIYEISVYLYISLIAGFINMAHSINLSDAVFWYGISLSSGVRSAIFISIVCGLFIIISLYLSSTDTEDYRQNSNQLKNIENSIKQIHDKQIKMEEKLANIEPSSKIEKIEEDMEKLSNKMIILAEQMAKIKSSKKN